MTRYFDPTKIEEIGQLVDFDEKMASALGLESTLICVFTALDDVGAWMGAQSASTPQDQAHCLGSFADPRFFLVDTAALAGCGHNGRTYLVETA